MYRNLLLRLVLAISLVLAACGGDDNANNGAPGDTGRADAAVDAALDAGADVAVDVGSDAPDAPDAFGDVEVDAGADADSDATASGVPLDGFGAITGTCGILDDELTSPDPSYAVNHIDFDSDPYDAADEALLTDGGREIIADGNAGGSSLYSEVFAYEMLHRCELADLLKTETEVTYDTTDTSITDLLVEIDGYKIGVSVTRAIAYPFDDPYTVQQATDLLTKKLTDIQESSAHVSPADAWQKQILYVIAYAPQHATSLQSAFDQLDASVRADTVVMVTVSDGDDAFLY